MNLSNLKSIKTKKAKRLGRGESSGKGKTASRGVKGQKKRSKIPIGFEGGQLPLHKRLPQRRGLGNRPITDSITITTGQLNFLPAKSVIDRKKLLEHGLISKSSRKLKLKVVYRGKLDKSLVVVLATSKKASSIITKAGGSVKHEDSA